ncbi:hypothetical protein [Paracoccus sulfuroxidans]|uniref:Phage tail tube protein n=1 Tax=Paracoccus sulfuroxidans TaxID=384678 RepID=A0A562NC40_9RHOB|nr:hypothetical protein [Paracoccus sulfuroxidans]TWI29739.1 hypothetical protein IQ24_03556 [Paracoccus sulfuroxidans]
MAVPELQYRGDILVMVAWDPALPLAHVPWCGATSIDLTIDNEMKETKVGDCDDWSIPVVTSTAYGAQNVSATVNATLTRAGRDQLIRAVLDQRQLPMRFHLVGAATGEIEYIDGLAKLPSLNITALGNLEGDSIAYTLNLRFDGGVEITEAA